MKMLSIQIASPTEYIERGEDERIVITHFSSREIDAGTFQPTSLISPGVVVLVPKSGHCTFSFDNKSRLLAPGVACVVDGTGMRNATMTVNGDGLATIQVIEISGTINGNVLLRDVIKTPATLPLTLIEECEQICLGLLGKGAAVSLPGSNTSVTRHILALRLVALLIAASGTSHSQARTGSAPDDEHSLRNYLSNNLDRNLTTDEMARRFNKSRSAFYRWAEPILNASPVRYHRNLRLEKGLDLLRKTGASIDSVALAVGFSSRQHFNKEFEKLFGATPAVLKKGWIDDKADIPYSRIETLIEAQEYDKALEECDASLTGADEITGSQLRCDKARCLYHLGRIDEALELWESLLGSSSGYDASKQLCSHHFRFGSYDAAVQVISLAYPQSDEIQRRELISVWSHQVTELLENRIFYPLNHYLDLRAKLFSDNLRTMPLTAHLLIGLGQNHRTPQLCSKLPETCLFGLWHAGMYDQAIKQYGDLVEGHIVASTLLSAGRPEEALGIGPPRPRIKCTALIELNRAEEAIRECPDVCEEAYIALGRYQELFEHFPRHSIHHVNALFLQGNTEAIKSLSLDDPFAMEAALFYSKPEQLLANRGGVKHRRFLFKALLWRAIECAAVGEAEQARQLLGDIPQIDSPDFWWHDRLGEEIILTTVVRGLTGGRSTMTREFEAIRRGHRFANRQSTWYDAGYIVGELEREHYLEQPCQRNLEKRLALVEGVRLDLAGQTRQACDYYRPLLKGCPNPELIAFIQWRKDVAKSSSQN